MVPNGSYFWPYLLHRFALCHSCTQAKIQLAKRTSVIQCRFECIGYPAKCQKLPKITITHDPAGAFDSRVNGLVIAGHTHCGQISLPFIGPLWVPSDAPRFAQCGLYQSRDRTLFVTSGIGTVILPLRYCTQSQWDFLELTFQ